MSVQATLPPRQGRPLQEVLGKEIPVAELVHDVTFAGRFCAGKVVITPTRVLVTEADEVVKELTIASATKFATKSLVGSGQLEAVVDQDLVALARFNMRQMPHFANAVKYLNKIAAGEETPFYQNVEEKACPKCGRVYPDESRICPACVNKVQIVKRLMAMARPHMKLIVVVMLLFWVSNGVRLIEPQLFRMLIDGVIKPRNQNTMLLLYYVGLIFLTMMVSTATGMVRGLVMTNLSARLGQDLRNMVYGKIQALSLNYLSKRKTGDLMNRVNGDTGTIQTFIQQQLADAINEGLMLIGVGVILFAIDWELALFVIAPAPLVMLIMSRTHAMFRHMYHRQWRFWDRTNSLLLDILSGMRVVKAFGQENREIKRFTTYSRRFADISASNERTFNTFFPLMGFAMGIGAHLLNWKGGIQVWHGEMQVGELVQYGAYASMIWQPLRFFTFIPRWFTQAMTAAERVFEVLDEQPDVEDKPNAKQHKINGRVEFENVTFGYRTYEPVLHNINITVEPGEMIGLVGHSGAGKSTFINLVCRFYDPDEGSIRIDGVDLRDIAQNALRGQIGVVLQEPFLFSGTVYENIAYAKPNASASEIIRAAKIANAHDFIMRFRDGYDTKVGEKGQRLSGGERQRISIARAILHDPRILILDEATASVDSDTEQLIQEALGRLVKNRTTFAIAHRLSTLRNANRLLVFEKGRIAETGTHEELYQQKGIYHRLVNAQMELFKMRETNLAEPQGEGNNGKP